MFARLLEYLRPAVAKPAALALASLPELAEFEAAMQAERFDEAGRIFQREVAMQAAPVATHYMQSRLAAERGDFSVAADCARAALELAPQDLRCLRALSVALRFGPRVDATFEAQQALLAMAPGDLELIHSTALTAKRQARYGEAEALFRRELELAPDHPQLHSALAFNQFQQGKYDMQAWGHFVQQMGINPWHGAPHPPERAWTADGEGAGLRIWHSGGFGDLFHFARFVPVLKSRRPNMAIELQMPESLREIAGGIAGVSAVVPPGTPLAQGQAHCSLLALPFILGADDASRFWTGPYIDAAHAPDEAAASLHVREVPGRVGIVWRSGVTATPSAVARVGQRVRDVPLADLLRALPELCEIVCLQQGEEAGADIDALPSDLRARLGAQSRFAAFADTVRAIRGVDLVVSVDTAVAHLAGAMGHPLCVLSDYDAYWAWRGTGGVTPWYPRARVLFQETPGQWAAPLARLHVLCEAAPPA